MGCGASKEDAENAKINKEQAKAGKDNLSKVKLLLLGTGDSGKTTLRKQMRNLYGEGFSDSARKQLAPVVMGNLYEGTLEVIKAVESNGETIADTEAVARIRAIGSATSSHLEQPEATDLISVMKDPAFIGCVKRSREYQLQDCWKSFSKQLVESYPKWGGPGWSPSTEDCVAVRVRTSGIVEEQFVIEGVTFNVFDVGGQRAERRKWIHSFDNVTAVIFVTAISEYDQVLFEDRNKNRLEEALELFEEICNSRWFLTVSMMLFLNKKDLFEEKFMEKKVPLNISGKFPTAPEKFELKPAIDWITGEFLKRKKIQEKQVFTHVTCATDPGNVRTVFDICRNIILKKSLLNSGFVTA